MQCPPPRSFDAEIFPFLLQKSPNGIDYNLKKTFRGSVFHDIIFPNLAEDTIERLGFIRMTAGNNYLQFAVHPEARITDGKVTMWVADGKFFEETNFLSRRYLGGRKAIIFPQDHIIPLHNYGHDLPPISMEHIKQSLQRHCRLQAMRPQTLVAAAVPAFVVAG